MATQNVLQELSAALEGAAQTGGRSIVRVDDGSRLTATGTIWSEDGLIVATSHGVERDEDLTIETYDGATLSATVVVRDPESDIAVLKADGAGLPAVQLSTTEASVGALVLALGRPGNAGLQATCGIVSAASGEPGSAIYHVDATLYPGFSGGALVNPAGQFIGLLNLGWRRGVAVGTGLVQQAVAAVADGGMVRRGYLGVGTQPVLVSEALQNQLGEPIAGGLLVISLDANGPAEAAGLYVGDTLLFADKAPTTDPQELRRALRRRRPGETVTLVILRGGKRQEVTATLGERPVAEESERHGRGSRGRGARGRRG